METGFRGGVGFLGLLGMLIVCGGNRKGNSPDMKDVRFRRPSTDSIQHLDFGLMDSTALVFLCFVHICLLL